MRLLGIRNVNLHQAVLPDLTGTPPRVRVKDPIHEPTFRLVDETYHLACGAQLVADSVRSGTMVIPARVVVCSDEEFARCRLFDAVWASANRRDWVAQYTAIAKVVEAFKAEAAYGVQEFVHVKLRAGRPRTVQGTAERMAADALGIELKTIRRAVRHAKGLPTRRTVKWAAPFETFGLIDPKDSTLHAISEIQHSVHSAASSVDKAIAAITRIVSRPDLALLLRAGTVRRIQDNLRMLGRMIRDELPASLCPVCKGLEDLQEACAKCDGLGWVGNSGLKGVRPELLDTQNPQVVVGTKLKSVGDA